ncbi:MAG: hypothetical protein AAF196_16455 [Planctomycetota bacterium]
MNLDRANRILGVLVVVLAVPVGMIWSSEATQAEDVLDFEPLFPGFTRSEVMHIRIEQPAALMQIGQGGPQTFSERAILELRRSTGGEWVVGQDPLFEGLPVLATRIDQKIFELMEGAPGGDGSLVLEDATDEELAGNLLNPERGSTITCMDADRNVLANLILGRRTNRTDSAEDEVRGFFVRDAESRDIRLFEREGLLVTARPADWFDQRLFNTDFDSVVSVTWRNATGRVVLYREADRRNIWRAGTKEFSESNFVPGELIHSEVTSYLIGLLRGQVANVGPRIPLSEAERLPFLDTLGLATPTTGVLLELEDGRKIGVTLGSDVTGSNTTNAWIQGWPFTIEVATDSVARELRRDLTRFFGG